MGSLISAESKKSLLDTLVTIDGAVIPAKSDSYALIFEYKKIWYLITKNPGLQNEGKALPVSYTLLATPQAAALDTCNLKNKRYKTVVPTPAQ